jgi:hypothetical protein
MGIWMVIWVVLMILWLFGGLWAGWPAGGSASGPPYAILSGTLIPWACVLILGLVVFGAVSGGAGAAVR